MNNVFATSLPILEKYDLKGSTINRSTPQEKRSKNPVLLDVDFLSSKKLLKIGKDKKLEIMDIIQKDCTFLESVKIMDYSLLVGVHKCGKELPNTQCGIPSEILDQEENIEIYFVGIIDILQKWNAKKRIAGATKGLRYERIKLSTVNPKDYANRFLKFMNSVMD
jgi:hypothetical protein